MVNILLIFLGLNSWYVDFYPVKKNMINMNFQKQYSSLKSINLLKLTTEETPSPKMESYIVNILEKVNFKQKIYFTIYTFYSFCIFCLLCVQPFYALIMFCFKKNVNYLSSMLFHINIPLIYIWAKIYFRKNHLENLNICLKCKTSLIIFSSVLSILLNFIDISSFYNEYYWLNNYSNLTFFSVIILEWIYSRLLVFTFIYSFLFVMNKHILRFKNITRAIKTNEFDFEENICLSNIIKELSKVRHEIEFTIRFYNDIISITTILGTLGIVIFVKNIFPGGFKNDNINFKNHDRYILHPVILFIIVNTILFINMSRYSYRRDRVLKYIKSVNFMNRFLSRLPSSKVMKKCNNDINMVILNITEETATTIDWIVLGNILSERWLDFTILGISTSDGQLIKKSITLGSMIMLFINFTKI